MEPRRIELPEAAKRCWPKAVELVGDLMSECATLEDDDWHLGGGTALAADWKRDAPNGAGRECIGDGR